MVFAKGIFTLLELGYLIRNATVKTGPTEKCHLRVSTHNKPHHFAMVGSRSTGCSDSHRFSS